MTRDKLVERSRAALSALGEAGAFGDEAVEAIRLAWLAEGGRPISGHPLAPVASRVLQALPSASHDDRLTILWLAFQCVALPRPVGGDAADARLCARLHPTG